MFTHHSSPFMPVLPIYLEYMRHSSNQSPAHTEPIVAPEFISPRNLFPHMQSRYIPAYSMSQNSSHLLAPFSTFRQFRCFCCTSRCRPRLSPTPKGVYVVMNWVGCRCVAFCATLKTLLQSLVFVVLRTRISSRKTTSTLTKYWPSLLGQRPIYPRHSKTLRIIVHIVGILCFVPFRSSLFSFSYLGHQSET